MSNMEAFLFYLHGFHSVTLTSDPLSGNVRMGVENVSSPSKTLMANGADNNSIFTFQTPRGSGLYLEQGKW